MIHCVAGEKSSTQYLTNSYITQHDTRQCYFPRIFIIESRSLWNGRISSLVRPLGIRVNVAKIDRRWRWHFELCSVVCLGRVAGISQNVFRSDAFFLFALRSLKSQQTVIVGDVRKFSGAYILMLLPFSFKRIYARWMFGKKAPGLMVVPEFPEIRYNFNNNTLNKLLFPEGFSIFVCYSGECFAVVASCTYSVFLIAFFGERHKYEKCKK